MTFRSFIKEEAASAEHALRFLSYKKDQHGVLSGRVRDSILSGWVAVSAEIPAAKVDARELPVIDYGWGKKKRQPQKKSDSVVVDSKSVFSKHGRRFRVGPVVKIGAAYDRDDRDGIKHKLFASARAVLTKIASKLNDGGEGPFRVSQRHHDAFDDLVLEFTTGHISEPIFVVGSDRGTSGDVVYFRDYVSRE